MRDRPTVRLRPVEDADLPIFLAHQDDPVAVAMAAFPTRAPDVFYEHWATIRADPVNVTRTIVADGVVAGDIVSWIAGDHREVGYWVGREWWGRGIATNALRLCSPKCRIGRSSRTSCSTTSGRNGSWSIAGSSVSARPWRMTACTRRSTGSTRPGRSRAPPGHLPYRSAS